MEYMLLSDGTVRPYTTIRYSREIQTELLSQGGVAYYWRDATDWLVFRVNSKESGGSVVVDIPDVIKLAAMLE